MARRTTAASRRKTPAKRDATQMVVSYGQIITYVFVGAIIGLAIGALALLMVLSTNRTTTNTQASVIQTY